MNPAPIPEYVVHPRQLQAMMHAGLVEPVGESGYRTYFGQQVTISRYVPEEGLFPTASKTVQAARRTEEGDERRREHLKALRAGEAGWTI